MGRRQLLRFGTDFSARTWRSLDPCGCLGVSLSVGVHAFAAWAVATHCLQNSLPAAVLYFGLYIPVALLALCSLYMAWSTDPGAVPMGARPLVVVKRDAEGALVRSTQRGTRRCHKCNDNFKPPRAHHDSVTGRCIVKFDHFCPWVGNAVGALNHKFFCLFLLYTASTCIISLLLLLLRVVHCGYVTELEEEEDSHDRLLATAEATSAFLYGECETFYSSRVVLGLAICSVLFLIFTCSMGCEQIDAISTGQGKIARLKSRGQQQSGDLQRVTEEFNEMFGGESSEVSAQWFNPFQAVWYPRNMKKVVLGYDWNNEWDSVPYQEDDDEGGLDRLENGNSAPPPPRQEFELAARSSSDGSMEKRVVQRKPSANSVV